MATATTEPVRLPPGVRTPKAVLGIAFLAKSAGYLFPLARRYGNAFTIRMPFMGQAVVVSDPILVKDLFGTSIDLIERPTSGPGALGEAFGPGSTFSLAGDKLLARRKVVFPQFHGKRVRRYEHIIEEEVMREIATWPEGREFETLPSMTSITLGAILRAILGAEGPALDELRDLVPPMPTLAGLCLVMPRRLRRDLGPWSPWGRYLRYRRRFDAIVDSLIADARADPALEERSDVLALLLHAHYEDGEPIPDRHIADELLALVASGHETTASQLSWAVERLRRHPRLLSRLTEEVDAGGAELRQATIWEVQRTRPVLDAAVRRTKTRIRLGDWVIPEDTLVLASIRLAQASEDSFRTLIRSIRIDLPAASRSPSPGLRSVAACIGVWARDSRTWRWMSPCAYCCANSVSCQPMRRANDFSTAAWRSHRDGAGERWFTGEPPGRRVMPNLHRCPTDRRRLGNR